MRFFFFRGGLKHQVTAVRWLEICVVICDCCVISTVLNDHVACACAATLPAEGALMLNAMIGEHWCISAPPMLKLCCSLNVLP